MRGHNTFTVGSAHTQVEDVSSTYMNGSNISDRKTQSKVKYLIIVMCEICMRIIKLVICNVFSLMILESISHLQ